MKIRRDTFETIRAYYPATPSEQGGIIGMKNCVVCEYIHDSSAQRNDRAIYTPNTDFLNRCIEKWADEGIEFCGIVHSHPKGQETLSSGDMDYIEELFDCNPETEKMFFPLIVEGCGMIVYTVRKTDGKLTVQTEQTEQIEIIN